MTKEEPIIPLDSDSIKGLRTRIIGKVINFHSVVGSTSELAKEIALSGGEEGTVVVSNKQTDGVGRLGRKWESPEGGLYISVVLRPNVSPGELAILPLIAGLSVSKAISTTCLIETTVKWPNDLLIEEKKVSGILSQSSLKGDEIEYAILGIGLNVNNSMEGLHHDIRRKSTSLGAACGKPQDRSELLRNILTFLDLQYQRLLQGGGAQMLEEWSDRCETIGRDVRVQMMDDTIRGTALGIDETGALMVKKGPDIVRVTSGDCIHLR